MSEKKPIERKLQRMYGMSAARKAEVERVMSTAPFRARCWRCKAWNEAPRNELKTCSACGANLWSRDG